MTAKVYFSEDYGTARRKFLEAAKAAGAAVETRSHPLKGPGGEDLACDTAWFGPESAERVLVTISATHGVEGFCGSGAQVGWFDSGLVQELPAGTALLALHAINPHGFAWLRRGTEENVDLNRNFIDFTQPHPVNPGYEELAEAIAPATWDDATIAATQAIFDAYRAQHGAMKYQRAVAGGQYNHPGGIFFGGQAPTWSHRTLKAVFAERLNQARHVAVVDYHTGLGPRGHGERICFHALESDGYKRADDWFGGDFTSPWTGTSSSSEVTGYNVIGMEQAVPQAAFTIVGLEYGTLPTDQVKLALRADNWLHLHGDLDSAKGKAIKRNIRDALYQDADDWKDMIWERGVETQRLMLKGLSES